MQECPDCGRLYPDTAPVCAQDGQRLTLAADSDPYLGRTAGSYLLVERIGRGGMGAVYLGQHPEIGSLVAVKVLHPRYATDHVVVERFFNEARAVNLIGHDGIVQVFDFGRLPEGTPYFVMEWLQGEPLSAKTGAPMPIEESTPIILEVADALQAAHAAGIVHRDLKPDNIFLARRHTGVHVKVLDFGIAKLNAATPDSSLTTSGMVMGTARYTSPEQAAGKPGSVSAASDIYSLGVVMYQLATGQLPFDKPTYAEQLTAHLRDTPRRPRELTPSMQPSYEAVILRCLEKRPEDRYESMEALGNALREALRDDDAPAVRSPRRSLALALIAALVAMTSGLVWWTKRNPVPAEQVVQTTVTPVPVAPTPMPTESVEPTPKASPIPAKAAAATPKPLKQGPSKPPPPSKLGDRAIDVQF